MKQKIDQKHEIDDDGNPTGGVTQGTGIYLQWQNGPCKRVQVASGLYPFTLEEPNGAFVEGVIAAAIGRLQFFQEAANRKFACRENAIAITKLEEALMWLEKRTADREARQVEGTYTP